MHESEDKSAAVAAGDAENGSGAENSPQSYGANGDFWEELEMEKPWPSTFERSISLLSSPIISAPHAELFTRSPKPGGTPLRDRRTERGHYWTPEAAALIAPSHRADIGEFDGKTVQKVHSLDFKKQYNSMEAPAIKPLLDTQKLHNKKAMEAKAYRMKLLKQQDEENGKQMSPGFKKEKKMRQREKEAAETLAGKATFAQCVFNMANILMGVGILALPYAFKSSGWYGGVFCLVIFGFVCWRTSVLIGRELNGDPRPSTFFDDSPFKTPLPPGSCAEARMRPPIKSFPDIARVTFGESGCFLLSLVLYFELFSCLCIFLVSIGDHLHAMFPYVSAHMHMLFVGAATVVPTVVLRTPRLLSYLSMVGTFSTVAVVLAVVFSAMFEGDISDHVKGHVGPRNLQAKLDAVEAASNHTLWRPSGLPLSLGLVAYCFSGHAIVPSIYSSMQRPQDFERMIDVSFLIVSVACLGVGFCGYYMFGDGVLDQVTLSLEENSSAVTLMKILTWLIIMTSFSKYILTMYPLALGMEEIIAPSLTSDSFMRFASFTIKLILTVIAVIVSIYVPSFNFICALVGMICTMSVSVIFPAAAHLKMFNNRLSFIEKFLDWIFVIIGVLMAIIGTIATIRDGTGV